MVRYKRLAVLGLIVVLLVSLTGCNFLQEELGIGKKKSSDPVTLSAPTIALDGDTLSWAKVDGAEEYRVRFAGSNGNEVFRTTTSLSMVIPDLEVDQYTISAMAKTTQTGYVDSSYGNQLTYRVTKVLALGEIELYVTSDGDLLVSWQAVNHAGGYEVRIEGGESLSRGQDATSCLLDLPSTVCTIQVRPVGNGLYLTGAWVSASFDPSDAVVAEDIAWDLKDGRLPLEGLFTAAYLDGVAVTPAYEDGVSYFDLRGQSKGLHTLRVTGSETKIYSITLTDTRPAAWRFTDGQVRWERHGALPLGCYADLYSNTALSLTLNGNNLEFAVTVDAVDGATPKAGVTLSVDLLNAMEAGEYDLVLTYRKVDGTTDQATGKVVLYDSPFALDKTEYNYGGGDLDLNIVTHGDEVTRLVIGHTEYDGEYFTSGVNSLTLSSSLFEGKSGEMSITLCSRLRPEGVTVTVAIGSDDLALNQSQYEYDKRLGGDLTLEGYLFNVVPVYGGSITTEDYTESVGVGGLTLLEDYLQSLPAGDYRYLAKGNKVDTYFGVKVFDSGCAPSDVRLNYDIDATYAYATFSCGCGGAQHSVVFDGRSVGSGDRLSLGEVDRTKTHTLTVSCLTNGKQTSVTAAAPASSAVDYLNQHYAFDGDVADMYIDSQAELDHLVKWLSYGGNYSSSGGKYGSASAEVYLSARFSEGLDLNTALSHATASFETPFSSSIGLSSLGNKLTVNIEFVSPVERDGKSGMSVKASEDTRSLAPEMGSGRSLYIDQVSVTQLVRNVVELADLPMGVRPTFDSTANSARAQQAYDAAVSVCDRYLSDEMTAYQKVTALYEWLALNVTYDRYTLVWYDLYARAFSGYSLSAIKTQVETQRSTYQDNATMTANFNKVLACTTIKEAQEVLDEILHKLSVFDAYGAMVERLAVCDGISDAFRLLCLVEGIPCLKATGLGVTSSGTENHAWNKVSIDGHWYVVDATWGRNGDLVTHRWLLLEESDAVDNHKENCRTNATSVVDTLADGVYDYYRRTSVYGYDLYVENEAEFLSMFNAFYRLHDQTVLEFEMGFDYNIVELMKKTGYIGSYSHSESGDIVTIILQ